MSNEAVIRLNRPQFRYMQARTRFKYVAYTAGYGSGKTFVGCAGLCQHMLQHPRLKQGYYAPTYPHIRDIFFPTIEEVAFLHGLKVKINESNKEVHMFLGKRFYGTIICRSMERPSTIVGYKVANSLIDELDVVNHDKARTAWRKIIARHRYTDEGLRNGVDVATTPEGFKFTYEQFVEGPRKDPALAGMYHIVQASTFDNARNLPADYIASLLASYPSSLIQAYLNGQFTNLTSGQVYTAFNRKTCTLPAVEAPGEHLHIGMDFNVGKMAAVVHVIRLGRPYAVREFVDLLDTPAMIAKIRAEYPAGAWSVTVYPDASGQNRKSNNASETDLSLLRAAGFAVMNNPSNPAVRDRILCMNRAFEDGYWVNVDRCPRYVQGLERQAYDKHGEPDKSSGFDHGNDAGGYAINWLFPLQHQRIARVKLKGT